MRDALAVAPADGLDELREVQVRDVDADALVGLDLVEQVAALGELEREPDPGVVGAGGEVLDDVGVAAEALVQGELDLDLLGLQAAYAVGVLFVDELDCDDGLGRAEGGCFADAGRRWVSGVAVGAGVVWA